MFPKDVLYHISLCFRAINNENDFCMFFPKKFPPALSKYDLRINSDQHPKNKSDDGTNKPPENRPHASLKPILVPTTENAVPSAIPISIMDVPSARWMLSSKRYSSVRLSIGTAYIASFLIPLHSNFEIAISR